MDVAIQNCRAGSLSGIISLSTIQKGKNMKTTIHILSLILIIASLAACTPAPTAAPTASAAPSATPTMEPSATPIPPTMTPTPEPTSTPEPTATATVVIDFEIPAAPQGIDPELWKTTYINMMTSRPRIKNLVEAGSMTLAWDYGLQTIAGTYGKEGFAYHQEFGFAGDIVRDTFGKRWIVREKLTMSQTTASSIWAFNQLHIPNSSELVLGAQSIQVDYGERIAIVGQIIGTERVDLSPYLSESFAAMTEDEAGIFYGGNHLVYEIMVVRVPTSNGFVDLKVPVCPVDYCNDPKLTLGYFISPSGGSTSVQKILEASRPGSMVYFTLTGSSNETVVSKESYLEVYKKIPLVVSNFRAFGNGDLNYQTLSRYFNLNLLGNYVADLLGANSIFDVSALSEMNYLSLPDGFLMKLYW